MSEPRTPGTIEPGTLYTVAEAAKRLRLGRHSMKKLLAAVPPIALGRRNRVWIGADIIAHVARQRASPIGDKPAPEVVTNS